jgi:hypothetical protein
MQPEIKSITIYVRQEQLDSFMRGENYNSLIWTLTPGDPHAGGFFSFKQVQMQVSLDTYYKLVDAQGTVDESMETDNQLEFPFEL